jgi:Ca2+:H+ antiporter
MPGPKIFGLPAWSLALPAAACGVLFATWGKTPGWELILLIACSLIATVLVAVFHAETIAHRIGEPMGTDRKSTRLNSSHRLTSRMPSSA